MVGVGRVMELDEGLSGEQGVMVLTRENGGFVMEQVDLCSLRATGGDSKGRVLDGLKLLDIGDGCGRSPDWGGVVYDGADDGVVGEGDGGFVLSPCPTGKGFEDVQTFFRSVLDVGDMVAEGEVSVKSYAEEFW